MTSAERAKALVHKSGLLRLERYADAESLIAEAIDAAVAEALAADISVLAASAVRVAEENGWWTTRAFGWLMGTYEADALANERAGKLRAGIVAWLPNLADVGTTSADRRAS